MPEPFKNQLNRQTIAEMGKLMQSAHPEFKYNRFKKAALDGLEDLELKDRSAHIAKALRAHLPADGREAVRILTVAIKPLPQLDNDLSINGWTLFPLNSYIAQYGLEAYKESIALIRELTIRFTAEFAIRPLIAHHPKPTLRTLRAWARDPNPHLRRLVSEGTRPRLPWAEQISAFVADPSPILPLLEQLKDDPSEYVRRSVANNLNDIAKDHPERMLDVVEKWLRDATADRKRLVKHACRSLVKAGHPRCLALLGFHHPKLEAKRHAISPRRIKLGEKITVTSLLHSTSKRSQKLVIDYRFHFVKANGTTAPKVFKGSHLTLEKQTETTISQTFHLKKVTTRKYYPGKTSVELLINGQPIANSHFTLAL